MSHEPIPWLVYLEANAFSMVKDCHTFLKNTNGLLYQGFHAYMDTARGGTWTRCFDPPPLNK